MIVSVIRRGCGGEAPDREDGSASGRTAMGCRLFSTWISSASGYHLEGLSATNAVVSALHGWPDSSTALFIAACSLLGHYQAETEREQNIQPQEHDRIEHGVLLSAISPRGLRRANSLPDRF
jgi:hypothetical protein